jgi:hypothetical protein
LRNSLKAALLSAFIFPGSGHILLKKYLQAALLATVATVCLYFLISNSFDMAQAISDKILNGEIQIDEASISSAISEQLANRDTQLINISTYIFVTSWLIGIIHSYMIGKAEHKSNEDLGN